MTRQMRRRMATLAPTRPARLKRRLPRRRPIMREQDISSLPTLTVTPAHLTLVCPSCGSTAPGDTTRFRCACGTPFDLPADAFPLEPAGAATLRARFHQRLTSLQGGPPA